MPGLWKTMTSVFWDSVHCLLSLRVVLKNSYWSIVVLRCHVISSLQQNESVIHISSLI